MKQIFFLILSAISVIVTAQDKLKINDQGYFEMNGLDVMVFSDFYPDGHQSGVTIIQHGNRVAANGDLKLEPSPGQWSPIPKMGLTNIDKENNTITKTLWYPDSSRNRKSFNPIEYPDLVFTYQVHITALEGSSFKIIVDLDKPLPEEWIGKVGFNFELFPGDLFGKSYLMGDKSGIFPSQPVGPMIENENGPLTRPLADGMELTIAPETELQKIIIKSSGERLELWDGRSNHNNGWFIVRSLIKAGATKNAIEWTITPDVIEGWQYKPVVQVSQLGYHPKQKKIAILEMDKLVKPESDFKLYKLTNNGKVLVKSGKPEYWGAFLRYNYATIDFTDVLQEGMYQLVYEDYTTHAFKISDDVYNKDSWQPTIEYFLPVQMCHMRINEKYRVWHDYCHLDDALMAPLDTIHFDGYVQGPSTLCKYKPLEPVPGLNKGGWHDAGDYDLRVESQIGTIWKLALMIEEFDLDYDATLIDQEKRLVEIHVPDGKSDIIQQIEHGLASVLGAYRSMGRLYRGIICNDLRQYVLLGDASSMTDNKVFNPQILADPGIYSGNPDDRWVFTEDNPDRELYVAAGLAAAYRVLRANNLKLADECLKTALSLWYESSTKEVKVTNKIVALCELILATNDPKLKKTLVSMKKDIIEDIDKSGWEVGHVINKIDDKKFNAEVALAVKNYQVKIEEQQKKDSPYGIPYKPFIWGAGWIIQDFGVDQYFFHKGWPGLVSTDFYENALNFVLGVHPGINTSSFVSGVGSKSVTVAYGVNRADWSFIPGGVVSGTALIRPDFPELKVWPFFWQQTEYVLGGGATNYMFLVLAVDKLYKGKNADGL